MVGPLAGAEWLMRNAHMYLMGVFEGDNQVRAPLSSYVGTVNLIEEACAGWPAITRGRVTT